MIPGNSDQRQDAALGWPQKTEEEDDSDEECRNNPHRLTSAVTCTPVRLSPGRFLRQ